jgi:hypothetical protein
MNFKPHFKHMVFQFQFFNFNFSFDQNGGFGATFVILWVTLFLYMLLYFNFVANCQILTNNIIEKKMIITIFLITTPLYLSQFNIN